MTDDAKKHEAKIGDADNSDDSVQLPSLIINGCLCVEPMHVIDLVMLEACTQVPQMGRAEGILMLMYHVAGHLAAVQLEQGAEVPRGLAAKLESMIDEWLAAHAAGATFMEVLSNQGMENVVKH